MDEDDFNFTMNVNTNVSEGGGFILNSSKNKKKDKKERYLEKKMLQNKRKRDKTDNNEKTEKTQRTKPDFNKNKNKNKNISNENKNDSSKAPLSSPNIKPESESDHVYDELNDFYKKQEDKHKSYNNQQNITPLTQKERNKKKKELEDQINEEIKAIDEVKEKETLNSTHNTNSTNLSHSVFSVKNFEDLELNQYLKKSLAKNNFTQMTKVQKKAIPILLKHKNVVVKSETGSGKTLAYVIPLYEHLIKLNEENKIDRKDGVYAVIFAPTHELCLQIEETFNKLKSACINVVYGSLMGGQKIDREKQKLRKGLNVLISTPGRLLYHLKNTQNLKFDKLKFLIFDEGDILLNMGFEKDIKECLSVITKKEETTTDLSSENFKKYKLFLISATIDNKIRQLVEFLMKGFKTVGFDLKNEEEELKVPNGLNQYFSVIYDEFRLIHLIAFLRYNLKKKVIIFVSTCDTANFLQEICQNLEIDKKNHSENTSNGNPNTGKTINSNNPPISNSSINLLPTNIYKLHGKMDHAQRKEIFKQFNVDQPGILISTDVAARGLDFPMVDWIIHYDINPDPKEYLNRMGRTARLDQAGNSLLFLMQHESIVLESSLKQFSKNMSDYQSGKILLEFVNNINEELTTKIKLEPEPYKDEVDENEKFRKKYFFAICPIQRCIKSYLFKSRDNLILARKAFKSSIRSYVTFMKFQKDVFNVKKLNLTRYARSFGLYKESTKIKVGDKEMLVDYQIEKNKTKGEKKFNNKKIQKRLMISEFDN